MRRRSRLLRVAKWGGVVACLVVGVCGIVNCFTNYAIRLYSVVIEVNDGWIGIGVLFGDVNVYCFEWESAGNSSSIFFGIPVYLFVGPLVLLLVLLTLPTALLWHLDRRRFPPGHCPCGYDLRGNVSGVCPECGNEL